MVHKALCCELADIAGAIWSRRDEMNIFEAVAFIVGPIVAVFAVVVLRTQFNTFAVLKSQAIQRRLPYNEDREKQVHHSI
jgi:hypothetical protein